MFNQKAKKEKAPSKTAALPFFFFALVTFLSDLPIVVPAFLLAIGLIVWKNQRDAMARAKLPPLPPSPGEQAQDNDELSSNQFGRTTLEPLPYGAEAPQESYSYYEPPPAVVVPPWEPSPAPLKSFDTGRTTSNTAASKSRNQNAAQAQTGHALLPNLRDARNLRQAIITMTVLGPPRALDPFETDSTQRKLP